MLIEVAIIDILFPQNIVYVYKFIDYMLSLE